MTANSSDKTATTPARNTSDEAQITTFSERPQPNVTLDPFHKALLIISVVVAVVLPVYFGVQMAGAEGSIPMQYDFSGEVTREGSVREAIITTVVLSVLTIGIAVLSRYPRIFNFPVVLTQENIQRQYKNGVQLLVWITASMAALLGLMVGSWLGYVSIHLVLVPVAVMLVIVVFFIARMARMR